jgi:hypothetical protein
MIWLFAFGANAAIAWAVVGNIEPCDPVLMIPVPVGNKVVGIVESADVELDDWRVLRAGAAFPGRRSSALATEGAFYPRRGIVDAAIARREAQLVGLERHKCDNRCAGVPPAAMAVAVAVAVADIQRLPDGFVAHRAMPLPGLLRVNVDLNRRTERTAAS